MNKLHTEDRTIVAASSMEREPGLVPYRIVIRDMREEHVVHTQVLEPGKKPWYHQGDYLKKRGDARTAGESDLDALCKTWDRFEERARRSLRLQPPQARRQVEVSDIAESIINTLLPEAEDEWRDLIADDYQFESDIETFEGLTGKAIKSDDHEPIVR